MSDIDVLFHKTIWMSYNVPNNLDVIQCTSMQVLCDFYFLASIKKKLDQILVSDVRVIFTVS